jgi:hypothetical protein
MGFSANDVVPFTQARANLSELADQAMADAEKIITKNGPARSLARSEQRRRARN